MDELQNPSALRSAWRNHTHSWRLYCSNSSKYSVICLEMWLPPTIPVPNALKINVNVLRDYVTSDNRMHKRGRETHCVVKLRLVATMPLCLTAKRRDIFRQRTGDGQHVEDLEWLRKILTLRLIIICGAWLRKASMLQSLVTWSPSITKHRPTHVHTYIKQMLYEAARPDFGGRDPSACHRNWHVPLPSYEDHMAYTRQTTSTSLRHITI